MKRLTKQLISSLCTFVMILLLGSNLAFAVDSVKYKHFHKTKHIRCDKGAVLSRFIKYAQSGDTFKIYGRCNDTIIIEKDNLRLVGVKDAIIDGENKRSEAVVLIKGVKGAILENISILNGDDQGVLATQGATGKLSELIVEGNKTVGISIDRSQFEMSNLAAIKNGSSGIDIFSTSTVVVSGKITASQNNGDGIAVNAKSYLELRGAQITASANVGSGVSIINDSRMQILSFPESQGSSVTASYNGFAGIGLLAAELGVVGSQYFGSGANVFKVHNNLIGFFLPAGAILSPHATAKFHSTENKVGLLMEDGASALIVGGLSVQDNDVGIQANGANTVNVVSVPPNPSFVVNNQLDVNAQFGSRITFEDVEVLSVVCDATVLVKGTLTCPTQP